MCGNEFVLSFGTIFNKNIPPGEKLRCDFVSSSEKKIPNSPRSSTCFDILKFI